MRSKRATLERGPRRRREANALDTTSRRNGRVKPAQPRRTSVRRTRPAMNVPHLRFGWYAGVAVMAIIELIEWPLAIVMMAGHEISHRTHSQALREFAEGVEAGA